MNEYKRKRIKNNILMVIISAIAGGVFTVFLLNGQESVGTSLVMGMSMGAFICASFISLEPLIVDSINKKPLPVQLLLRTLSRTAVIFIGYWLLVILFFLMQPPDGISIFNMSLSEILIHSKMRSFLLPTVIFSFIATFIMETTSIISHLLGQSTLIRLLSGRYNKPFEEDRIFMFLDLKGSTTIAESHGNRAFHSFINDFFYAITPSIVESKGEIYKYIGDEVIVSWNMKQGVKSGNFLRSFFLIESAIQREAEKFKKKYGTIPQFRAGIHTGKVVVGEMGDFRKEIAYLGDIVNTTARIIDEAGKREKTLLISSEAHQLVSVEDSKSYVFTVIDQIALRGKINETELIEVQKSEAIETPF